MAITLKVYKNSPEHGEYMNARFPKDRSHHSCSNETFEYKGHRWKYQVTSFDDNGDYDLLRRPDGKEPELMASDATLRDYFAAKYMGGCGADPQSDAYFITADLAYKMADAMLKARG
ncbi:hypothetical protein LHV25_12900 [Providencia rettgeri]|uniref:hypothetical protein n=1 Tax=Providencia rettgeri TaxID=587 RepID=UPI001CFEDAC5|nr:hypothetical protein [Providencia rettgeri]MCB4855895.1 hypothetical protein [Providencia rettgeri]MCD6315759.1 hypothetical protein [Providencia rettgeri]